MKNNKKNVRLDRYVKMLWHIQLSNLTVIFVQTISMKNNQLQWINDAIQMNNNMVIIRSFTLSACPLANIFLSRPILRVRADSPPSLIDVSLSLIGGSITWFLRMSSSSALDILGTNLFCRVSWCRRSSHGGLWCCRACHNKRHIFSPTISSKL